MNNNEYRYIISLRYPYNGEEKELDSTNIKVMTINYDYEIYNSPIIFL